MIKNISIILFILIVVGIFIWASGYFSVPEVSGQVSDVLEVRLSASAYQQFDDYQENFTGAKKTAETPKPPAPLVAMEISEIQAGSDNGAKDEFVKLFNPNNFVVNLDGWSLKKKTASGKEYSLVAGRSFGGNINASGYFLVAHQQYQGQEKVDLIYSNKSNSIADGNVVLLYDTEGRLINEFVLTK